MLELVSGIKNYNKFEEIENFKNNQVSQFTFKRSKFEKIKNYFLISFGFTFLLSLGLSFTTYYNPAVFAVCMFLFFIGFSLSFFNFMDKKFVLSNIKNEDKRGIFYKYVFYKKAFQNYINSLNEEELYVFNYNYKISDKLYCLIKESNPQYLLQNQGEILIGIDSIINGKVKKQLLDVFREQTKNIVKVTKN